MWQWPGIICGSLVVLFVLGVAVYARIVRRRFLRSPEGRWREAVLQAMDAAYHRAQAEEEEMRRAGITHETDDQALRDQAFHAFLAGISVAELDAYPGIGPVTVSKLRDAGYTNLAALHEARIEVDGLGQKRLADVTHAVGDLVKQARGRFNAGACREARDLEGQLQVARGSRSEQGFRAQARHLAALKVMHELGERAHVAAGMDLPAVLRGEFDPALPSL